jgi:hypothetical protein
VRTSESADTQTRNEDRNRDEHTDILVGSPDGVPQSMEEPEGASVRPVKPPQPNIWTFRPRAGYRV